MATLFHKSSRRLWLTVLVYGLSCMPTLVPENAFGAEFSVSRVTTQLHDEVYYLNADLRLRLSDAVIEAVDSGVSVVFELQIEVVSPRSWWWDETVYALSQRYRLKFHALTRQYVVTNLNSGVQQTYPTRTAAIIALSTVTDLPILDRSALKVGYVYLGRMRVRLAVENLPSPLRIWAYLSSDWDLVSDWYQWPLQ